jgi:hypothetical protein
VVQVILRLKFDADSGHSEFMAGINVYIATRSAEYPAPNSAICAVRSVEARIAYISAKKR